MSKLKKFLDSLMLTEELEGIKTIKKYSDDIYLISNKINLNSLPNEKVVFSCKVVCKDKKIIFIVPPLSVNKKNIELLRSFLNKKFEGKLMITIITKKDYFSKINYVLEVKGHFESLKQLIIFYEEIINEFVDKKINYLNI